MVDFYISIGWQNNGFDDQIVIFKNLKFWVRQMAGVKRPVI